MKRRTTIVLMSALLVLAYATIASASFVTCVADSFFNSKNYAEALKHYQKLSAQYHETAAKPEKVSYLFGYEQVKKNVVKRSTEAAGVALYCYYMQALCDVYLKDYAGAINAASRALACFAFDKQLTPKSLTSTGQTEIVRIALSEKTVAEYTARIAALPLPVGEVLKVMERMSRERYAVELQLASTPEGPAHDQLMARLMGLIETEKIYGEFVIGAVSRDLDAKNFASFESLVAFMKAYNPIDRSVTAVLAVSDKVIKKMTSITVALQSSDIPTATLYGTKMQALISVNAYVKGYLATSGR